MFDLAIYYRMAGGFVGFGNKPIDTQFARLRWAAAITFYMLLCMVVHRDNPLTVVMATPMVFAGAFMGRLIPHAAWQGMTNFKSNLYMSLIGLARVSLVVMPYAVINFIHFDVSFWRLGLIAFGLLQGTAYYLGNKYLEGKDAGFYYRTKHEQWRIRQVPVYAQVDQNTATELDQGALGGSEWGECLTGFMVWQLMYVAALVMP